MTIAKRQITVMRKAGTWAVGTDQEYEVVSARNTTTPRVHTALSEEAVNSLIDAGTEVVIKQNR